MEKPKEPVKPFTDEQCLYFAFWTVIGGFFWAGIIFWWIAFHA